MVCLNARVVIYADVTVVDKGVTAPTSRTTRVVSPTGNVWKVPTSALVWLQLIKLLTILTWQPAVDTQQWPSLNEAKDIKAVEPSLQTVHSGGMPQQEGMSFVESTW